MNLKPLIVILVLLFFVTSAKAVEKNESCSGWISPTGGIGGASGRGVIVKIIEEKQDLTKQSTDDRQYIKAKVNFTNTNDFACLYVETAVLVDGICSNWEEAFDDLSFLPRGTRPHYCYISLWELNKSDWGRLLPNESKIVEITYHGDWVNLTCSEVEQDLTKKSTLDRQYLIKECELKSKKKISWKDILVNTSMLGECEDCVRNVSIKKPVLWLNFDEGEGDIVYDKSGYDNDGIIYGAKWVDGKYGKALEFDGKDGYVDCRSDGSLNPTQMTISTWLKFHSLTKPVHQTIVGKWDKAGKKKQYVLSLFSSKVSFFVSSDGSAHSSAMSDFQPDLDKWYHVVGTYNGTNTILYINGILIETKAFSGDLYSSVTPLQIGQTKNWDGRVYWLNGTMDEIRIYNRALTEDEIKYDYLKGKLDKQVFLFHSSKDFINYNIEELKKLELVNDIQFWSQKIIINNIANTDLFNIDVSIPIDLKLEPNSLNCSKNVINLIFDDSQISFTIPKLDENETYEIRFSTKLPVEASPTEEESSSITGMVVNVLNTFLASPISQYIIIIDLLCIIVIISYFIHSRRKNES